MKTSALTLMGIALLSTSAGADEADSLFAMLSVVKGDPDAVHMLVSNAGITMAGAEAVVAYAAESFKALEESGKRLNKEVCADPAKLKASRANFADALQKLETESRAERDNILANIGVVLSQSDEEKLKNWALGTFHPSSPDLGFTSIAEFVRAGHGDHVAGVDATCGNVQAQS